MNHSIRETRILSTGRFCGDKLANHIWYVLRDMDNAGSDYSLLNGKVNIIIGGVPANAYGCYRKGIDGSHNIHIRHRKRSPQGLAFTLAHELRHAYQVQSGWLSTMQGGAWKWYGKGTESLPPVLCDGSDNDPSEQDANQSAMAYCHRAWNA